MEYKAIVLGEREMFEKIVQVSILCACLFICYTLKFGGTVQKPNGVKPVTITEDMSMFSVMGNKDAKNIAIIVSDYECPYCSKLLDSKLYEGIIKGVKLNRVKLYVSNFPLPMHKNAEKAAEASLCSGDRFWEMDKVLHANYSSLSLDKLPMFAEEAGLDRDVFKSCLDNSEGNKKMIDKQAKIWQDLGVSGTPTVILAHADKGVLKGSMFNSGPPEANDFERWMNK